MTAYDRVCGFLADMGGSCEWKGAVEQITLSEWSLRGAAMIVAQQREGRIQLFERTISDQRGAPDGIMDRLADIAQGGGRVGEN